MSDSYDPNGIGLYQSYDAPDETAEQAEESKPRPRTTQQPQQETGSQDGAAKALAVIADPVELITEAVNPQTTKLPIGLAIIGALAVAVIWADSWDRNHGR